MVTKLPWPAKVKIWEMCYLQGTPIDRIRASITWKSKDNDVTPSWPTVKRVVQEFLSLTGSQVGTLPAPLQARWNEPDIRTIPRIKPADDMKTERETSKEARTEQGLYEETPHKQEESLIVHDLSAGDTNVEFLVANMSNSLLVVDQICAEVMNWEQYDGRLTTGARIINYKYKVKIKPNFIGEIPVSPDKFKYAKGEIDSFSIFFVSSPGYKYITKINFHCSDPETGKRFSISTDKFEIRFHKHRTASEGLSEQDTITQAQKLIHKGETKRINSNCSDPGANNGRAVSADESEAIAVARRIVNKSKRKK